MQSVRRLHSTNSDQRLNLARWYRVHTVLHTVLPATYTFIHEWSKPSCIHFVSIHQMASPERGGTHLDQLTTQFIDPDMMKGWVGLIGGPIVDVLTTTSGHPCVYTNHMYTVGLCIRAAYTCDYTTGRCVLCTALQRACDNKDAKAIRREVDRIRQAGLTKYLQNETREAMCPGRTDQVPPERDSRSHVPRRTARAYAGQQERAGHGPQVDDWDQAISEPAASDASHHAERAAAAWRRWRHDRRRNTQHQFSTAAVARTASLAHPGLCKWEGGLRCRVG